MILKIITFFPLLGFLIAGFLNKNIGDRVAQVITSFLIAISAILSIYLFVDIGLNGKVEIYNILNWINSGDLVINWAVRVDSLTSIMLVVVNVVSLLVHIYSSGYMKGDRSIPRFMSYLSLFTFFMLMLVTSDNFVQLFFGWEGVGLASYLLIGFWFKKNSANAAAVKAFVTNRVGDLGLIIAIALIYLTYGSLNFDDVFRATDLHQNSLFTINDWSIRSIDAICILLFIGAMGKSAQFGLHVWLPDAMEGPTPVSALIHAATMVTAGVFLVARCSFLFEYSPISLNIMTIVGAITAFFAATIAITQNDIKKIIAYSTCSQLGYMFFACGLSIYSGAIFHLATHAFFKALLFLGAGSVIYSLHHEQNIHKMGGIYKKLPITYAIMWIGTLAIIGFPLLSGYYSKDIILESAYISQSPFANFAFTFGIIVAFLTAFYSFRLLFLVFHGKAKKRDYQIIEAPMVMRIPLFILAFGAVFAGAIGYYGLDLVSQEKNFFDGVIFSLSNNQILADIHHISLIIKKLPVILGILAVSLAYLFYIKDKNFPKLISQKFSTLYKISQNKWYIDELYQIALVNNIKKISKFYYKVIDVKIIDNLIVDGFARRCKFAASKISKIQTGFIYHYFTVMFVGLLLILGYLLFGILTLF